MTGGAAAPANSAATTGYVVQAATLPVEQAPGDTAKVRTTIDASTGCDRLTQRELRCGPGRSAPRGPGEGAEEVLYVVAGHGSLVTTGGDIALEPELGVHVPAGTGYQLDNPGPDELVLVGVTVPAATPAPGHVRAVPTAGQPAERTGDREFRRVVDPDTGCAAVTQFVGVIPPGRAPAHSHSYDEVVYVLDGEGVIHLGGQHRPIGVGTCVHLPPPVPHCLENTGSLPLRVLGVFHPAGSPAAKKMQQG